MGRRFTPNCKPASSLTSAPYSKRSRESFECGCARYRAVAFRELVSEQTSNIEPRTRNPCPCPLDVRCLADDFSRRVMGAWWPPRSSKPSSVRFTGRGRFDSCPLRHVDLRFTIHDLRFEEPTRAAVSAGLCINRKSQFVNPEEGGGRGVARTDS